MNDSSNNTVKVMLLSVILVVVVLGGVLAVVVVNNNMKREAQAEQREAALEEENKKERAANAAKLTRDADRRACIQAAEDAYQSYVKLNAISKKQTPEGEVYSAPQEVWDNAEAQKKTATDDCYRQYPS